MYKFMKNNQGFTLVEMIIVVAVLAVVVTMAFPDMINVIRTQREVEERLKMVEVQKALQAHAKKKGRLPLVASWTTDLAEFTKLTEAEIREDVYGNARVYSTFSSDLIFREGSVKVYYSSIVSFNEDGCWGEISASCTADVQIVDVDEYKALALDAVGNDFLVKYTDFQDKMDSYAVTNLRLNKISDSLASYSNNFSTIETNQNINDEIAEVALTYPNASGEIFYPPSIGEYSRTDAITSAPMYSSLVKTDITGFGTTEIDNSGTVADRKTGMQTLMRLLGLPESYCCNALDMDSATDEEVPFYYYSNPSAGGACAGGADELSDRKLPPKVSVTPCV